MSEKTYKRRRGDRKDGRWLRELDPYYAMTPFIMQARDDSQNFFTDSIEITETEKFLRKKRAEGLKGLGMLHMFVAAYVRAVSQRPGLNRFISGQRIYSRNNIEVVMTVKKSMESDAGETSIKVVFDPKDTITDVYNKMNEQIMAIKDDTSETSTDSLAGTLMKLPRFILRFFIWLMKVLDYYGKMPGVVMKASPFHGSMIITDMGSLGIPPIYHHLYNFGNLPIFLSFGSKRREFALAKSGEVEEKKYIDYSVVMDERICDGFYFAQSVRYLKSFLNNPYQLDDPPEKVVEEDF